MDDDKIGCLILFFIALVYVVQRVTGWSLLDTLCNVCAGISVVVIVVVVLVFFIGLFVNPFPMDE
jgi:hypothetical protein